MAPAKTLGLLTMAALPELCHAASAPPPLDFPGALLLLGAAAGAVLLCAARLIGLLRRVTGSADGR